MPLFRCESCGCVENTALSNYWTRGFTEDLGKVRAKPAAALCSACDPDIAKWHDAFPKRSAEGMFVGGDGFLYGAREWPQVHHTTKRGIIKDGREVAAGQKGRR